jgi:hypothetical protein
MKLAQLLLLIVFFSSHVTYSQNRSDNPALYDTIMKHDSIFFYAYNHCDSLLEAYAGYYADDLEFYHDRGGFSNSKKDVVEATQKNICGKVHRDLIPGSVEVYPIADYGAIEIGFHRFTNNQNPPGTVSRAGRFVLIWKKLNDKWRISRVVSLH